MDDLLRELQDLIRKVESKTTELQSTVNKMLRNLPGWVPDKLVESVQGAWNDMCQTMQEEMQIWYDAIDQVGEPWTLRPAADNWPQTVGSGVSSQEAAIGQGALLVDDRFEGTAASAYKGHIAAQTKAVASIGTLVKPLQEGLDKISSAINGFIGALIAALIPVVALIVAGILACLGVITAPPGLLAIAGGLVVAGGAAYVGYVTMKSSCEDVQGSWIAANSMWSGFDGNHWPKATF